MSATEECVGAILGSLEGDPTSKPATSWLAHLVDVSARVDPTVAAYFAATTLERESDTKSRSRIASTLATISERMEPTDGARLLGTVLEREAELLSSTAPNNMIVVRRWMGWRGMMEGGRLQTPLSSIATALKATSKKAELAEAVRISDPAAHGVRQVPLNGSQMPRREAIGELPVGRQVSSLRRSLRSSAGQLRCL